jgi:probable HAF family extracellular repeat protein
MPLRNWLVCTTWLFGVLSFAPIAAYADSGSVTNLGTLGGSESSAQGISPDGNVVVGFAYPTSDPGYHVFRWTESGGMTDLGTLGGTPAFGYDASSDGDVLVGYSYLSNGTTVRIFRWTESGGMVDIGTLGGTNALQSGVGVSSDGNVVVGATQITGDSAYHAFRWTQTGGMVDLGTLGGSESSARAVSADGDVVVGGSYITGQSFGHAFRWTQLGGMIDLGTLGGNVSAASAVSADGNTVVGSSIIANNAMTHAFRWTQIGGMVDLGTLGGNLSNANAVSATGNIVVGKAQINGVDYHAFRWTEATGMSDLNTLLNSAGVNMTGIVLTDASSISENGQYIAGLGTFSGLSRGFLVSFTDGTLDGFTTSADQQKSVQSLSDDQRGQMIESRITANELLGTTRPINDSSYTFAGAMFGSAVGYTGGQYSMNGMTVLGGIAYGAQDYSNIEQDAATTIAAAIRYAFGNGSQTLRPFVELGGWVTPQADMTLSRNYSNGIGTSTGTGTTEATSWAGYGRLGVTSSITPKDKLTGFAELGQQYMSFSGYSETASASNPFPATVSSGLVRMSVMRAGGSWTHNLADIRMNDFTLPVSLTLAGAIAHSFDVHSGLTANSGLGTSTAANTSDTWGEFGARLEGELTKNIALDLDISGTTSDQLGTSVHGGIGMSYKF